MRVSASAREETECVTLRRLLRHTLSDGLWNEQCFLFGMFEILHPQPVWTGKWDCRIVSHTYHANKTFGNVLA